MPSMVGTAFSLSVVTACRTPCTIGSVSPGNTAAVVAPPLARTNLGAMLDTTALPAVPSVVVILAFAVRVPETPPGAVLILLPSAANPMIV